LNVPVTVDLYCEVKKAAIDGRMKLWKFVEFVLGIWLYLKENLGLQETFERVQESYPLALLLAARNDLSHKGFDVSKLDEVIESVEAFLQKVPRKGRGSMNGL